MASAFAHATAALAIGTALRPRRPVSARFWVLGATCAVVPDLDSVGYWLGVPYGSVLGHRGLTHSLLFAAALATVVTVTGCAPRDRGVRCWLFLWLACASHGMLDAMTTGGLGVAFFSPIDNHRFFFPWRPIPVSPLSIGRFFSPRGLEILTGELLWVGVTSAILAGAAVSIRRFWPTPRAS